MLFENFQKLNLECVTIVVVVEKVASTNADFALLNSGTLRSDTIHAAGPFFVKDLVSILPMIDPLVLLEIEGLFTDHSLLYLKGISLYHQPPVIPV